MKYLARLTLFLIIVLVSLGLGEFAIRLWFEYSQNYDIEMWKYAVRLKKSAPDRRGHIHIPGQEAVLMGAQVRINELGWRDRSVQPSDLDSENRILFAGDSICFGWGVNEGDRFSNLFQNWLRTEKHLKNAVVFNGGVGNYNSSQVSHFLRKQAQLIRPTEIIYAFFINDLEPAQTKQYGFVLSHCLLFATIKSVLARFIGHARVQGTYLEYYSSLFQNSENLVRFKRDVARMKTTANQLGDCQFKVLLIPELHQLDPYPFESNYQQIKNILSELGIPYIDALTGFDMTISPEKYWVASDDAHPNKMGNQAIFKALIGAYEDK